MIDAHKGAFEYDWRTRFHEPLTVVGCSMSFGEALRLTQILANDPGSQVGASLSGWSYAADRSDLALRDLFDLTHQIAWAKGGRKGKTPDPYPRPWPSKDSKHIKPRPDLTQDEVIAALRMAGHTAPLPI